MSKDDPCRCGATAAWLLSPVREHEGPMAVEVHGSGRKFEQLGWYEALVCGGCGYARFWARDFAPERVQQPIDACAACENTSGWIVAAVPDVVGPRDAVGVDVQLATTKRKLSLIFSWHGWHAVLAARICGACGTAAWFCRPEPAPFPEDLELAPRSPEPCHRCGGARARVRLDDVQPKDRGYGHEWRTISGHQGFWSFTARATSSSTCASPASAPNGTARIWSSSSRIPARESRASTSGRRSRADRIADACYDRSACVQSA